ncbi:MULTISPECIES: SoxR reducing system RseC family protein [Candidatus Ichthyocystis]|uniref:SoxR reducing system RseC family protein n=1 Tax=Candidatus Ichthyocystis TaxID=2929841 RepID=UPI000B838EC9|nr:MULTISPECIES: SoxR reducing system RseC family protein [Ichthyocystis]
MDENNIDNVTVCVRVESFKSSCITVCYLNAGNLCSRCLALGYCASQRVFLGSVVPLFSMPCLIPCKVGDILRVSISRKEFISSLMFSLFLPTLVFLIVAMSAEFFNFNEIHAFLLSCFSFCISIIIARFYFSHSCLKSTLSCEKLEL